MQIEHTHIHTVCDNVMLPFISIEMVFLIQWKTKRAAGPLNLFYSLRLRLLLCVCVCAAEDKDAAGSTLHSLCVI
jgi:hypothetical protein